jgi:hypothetical protein
LVEHLLCKQGVIGSNPIVSIGAKISKVWARPHQGRILWFPKAFGLWWVKGKAFVFLTPRFGKFSWEVSVWPFDAPPRAWGG